MPVAMPAFHIERHAKRVAGKKYGPHAAQNQRFFNQGNQLSYGPENVFGLSRGPRLEVQPHLIALAHMLGLEKTQRGFPSRFSQKTSPASSRSAGWVARIV